MRCRTLHGQQQTQQLTLLPGTGKFGQSPRQRLVLRLTRFRQARRVGGQKSKRVIRVFAVFSQVEMHPAHHVPDRVAGF